MFRESQGRSYNLEICFVWLSMTTSRMLKSTTFLMDRIEFTLLMIKLADTMLLSLYKSIVAKLRSNNSKDGLHKQDNSSKQIGGLSSQV